MNKQYAIQNKLSFRKKGIITSCCAILLLAISLTSLAIMRSSSADNNVITPEMYGAKGNGTTDDTKAINTALKNLKSGQTFKFDPTKKYRVSGPLYFSNLSNITVSGSTLIADSNAENYTVFWITDCSDSTFSNFSVSSTHNQKTVTTPGGHQRPGISSNVFVFSGRNNTDIVFKDNSFNHVDVAYWFNSDINKDITGWNNITIENWTARDTIMPIFGQKMINLTIKNADIEVSADYAGDGDHGIYAACYSKNIRVEDSKFYYSGTKVPGVLLTFHCGGGSYDDTTVAAQPVGVTIRNTELIGGQFRALWSASPNSVNIYNSKFSSNNTLDNPDNSYAILGGDKSIYYIYDSEITTNKTAFANNEQVFLENTTVNSKYFNSFNADKSELFVANSKINFAEKADFNNSQAPVRHTYINSTITRNSCPTTANNYLFSKRATVGSIIFSDNTISGCGSDPLFYNGANIDMSGIVLYNNNLNGIASISTNNNNLLSANNRPEKLAGDSNVTVRDSVLNIMNPFISINEVIAAKYYLLPNKPSTIKWTSSNPAIASVDGSGVIRGIKPGVATITASAAVDGQTFTKSTTITVTNRTVAGNVAVTPPASQPQQPGGNTQQPGGNTQQPGENTQQPSGGTQQPDRDTQQPGNTNQEPGASQQPSGGAQQQPNNEQQPGNTQQPEHGQIISVNKIELETKAISLLRGKSFEIRAQALPVEAENRELRYESSNPEVVAIDGATIIGKAPGEAIITITAFGDISETVRVTVFEPAQQNIDTFLIKLNERMINLNVGNSFELTATVQPETNDELISWSSSNEEIATVDGNGLIHALAAGETTITAKHEASGLSAECRVIVSAELAAPSDLDTDANEREIETDYLARIKTIAMVALGLICLIGVIAIVITLAKKRG